MLLTVAAKAYTSDMQFRGGGVHEERSDELGAARSARYGARYSNGLEHDSGARRVRAVGELRQSRAGTDSPRRLWAAALLRNANLPGAQQRGGLRALFFHLLNVSGPAHVVRRGPLPPADAARQRRG